jgi:ribose transport system substrate-binding protein
LHKVLVIEKRIIQYVRRKEMKKIESCLLIVSLLFVFAFGAMQVYAGSKEPEVIEKEVPVEKIVEVEKESPYALDKLLAMARAGRYEGAPASGHKLAFANFLTSFPFCKSVEDSIIEQWKLAGGRAEDLTVLDNAADTSVALQNADIILNKKPEVFIQFQIDARLNAMVARKYKEVGIPILAVDVPVPGNTFMGVDNWGVAVQTGDWIVDQINAVYGGWNNVDVIFIGINPQVGETVALRWEGITHVLIENYGQSADPSVKGSKVVYVDAGSTTEASQPAFQNILSAYPDARNIIIACANDQTLAGSHAALEIANRWEPDNILMVSQGVDGLGIQLLRNGIVDGDLAYFPERYGWYLVPAALALMYGNPIPSHIYIENEIITPAM